MDIKSLFSIYQLDPYSVSALSPLREFVKCDKSNKTQFPILVKCDKRDETLFSAVLESGQATHIHFTDKHTPEFYMSLYCDSQFLYKLSLTLNCEP